MQFHGIVILKHFYHAVCKFLRYGYGRVSQTVVKYVLITDFFSTLGGEFRQGTDD